MILVVFFFSVGRWSAYLWCHFRKKRFFFFLCKNKYSTRNETDFRISKDHRSEFSTTQRLFAYEFSITQRLFAYDLNAIEFVSFLTMEFVCHFTLLKDIILNCYVNLYLFFPVKSMQRFGGLGEFLEKLSWTTKNLVHDPFPRQIRLRIMDEKKGI